MTIAQRRELATLLGERVKDKADRGDFVGQIRAASMLDQVNEELEEMEGAPPAEPATEPTPGAGWRRIFVKG